MLTLLSEIDRASGQSDNGRPMECTLALIADAANREVGGKLNVLGAFDQIYAAKFPIAHPQLYVVVRLTATPAEFGLKKDIEISLRDPDGKLIAPPTKGKATVPAPDSATRSNVEVILRMVNILFEKPGHYQFSLLVSGDEKASIPLEVVKLTQQQLKEKM